MTSHTTQTAHSTDPQPEDLPFDAAPGTDEEFGVHAATMHIPPHPSKPPHRSTHTTNTGAGATDSIGNNIEGVLLRLVHAS
jgi:hypothetical protein